MGDCTFAKTEAAEQQLLPVRPVIGRALCVCGYRHLGRRRREIVPNFICQRKRFVFECRFEGFAFGFDLLASASVLKHDRRKTDGSLQYCFALSN